MSNAAISAFNQAVDAEARAERREAQLLRRIEALERAVAELAKRIDALPLNSRNP